MPRRGKACFECLSAFPTFWLLQSALLDTLVLGWSPRAKYKMHFTLGVYTQAHVIHANGTNVAANVISDPIDTRQARLLRFAPLKVFTDSQHDDQFDGLECRVQVYWKKSCLKQNLHSRWVFAKVEVVQICVEGLNFLLRCLNVCWLLVIWVHRHWQLS